MLFIGSTNRTFAIGAGSHDNDPMGLKTVVVLLMASAPFGCEAQGPSVQSDAPATDLDGAPSGAAPSCAIAAPGVPVAIGATPTLAVLCDRGTQPFTYQWHKAAVPIANAMNAAYTLRTDTDTASAGTTNYAVTVSNSAGTTTVTTAVVVAPRATTTCPSNALWFFMQMNDLSFKAFETLGQSGMIPMVIQVDVGAASQASTAGRADDRLPKLWYFERPSFHEAIKEVTISTSPCNFDSPEFVVSAASDFNQGGWKYVTVNDPRVTTSPKLTQGRWYINLRSAAGACDPSFGDCNTHVSWIP